MSQGVSCALATNVSPGTFTAPIITGTGASQPGAPGAIWYKFTPTTNGNLSINSCGGGSDTRLWIWSDSCGNLTLLGANDDFNGCISSGTNSVSIVNLASGNYAVTVTDLLGCTNSQSYNLQSQSNIQFNNTTTQVDCPGNTNGQITLSPTNGIAPYQFNWSSTATTNTLNNLSTGIYFCIVSDALACQKSFSDTLFTLSNLTTQVNGTSIVCDSSSAGSVSLSATNGVLPYSYSWMNSAETTNTLQTIGPGLVAGIVTDGLNCQETVSFQINLTDLSATNQIVNVTCPGGQTGSINVIPQGGQEPYTYSWVDFTVNDSVITGINAGNYICSVQDQLGCSVSLQNVVYEPFPWTINAVITPEIFGLDGVINLGVSGATPTYTYSWSSGQSTNDLTQISGGEYYMTMTDSEGCQVVDTFQVDSQVSISEFTKGETKLYPNPNDGSFNLSIQEGEIRNIYDTYGRSIPFEVEETHSTKNKVQLNQPLPGVYYLEIVHENEQVETIRFEVF